MQSDDYKSGHMHLILMNDILPLKNGLEILHILRHMPNEKKFIIYMMSERNSEGRLMLMRAVLMNILSNHLIYVC